MKDNGSTLIVILPAVAGGILFIFLFAVLKLHILIALVISIIALIVFMIILFRPPKSKVKKTGTLLAIDMKSILENSKAHLKRLNQLALRLENKKMVEQLKIIIADMDKMIKLVSENPSKYKKANKYLNYYPETMIKILEQYDEIEDNRLKGSEAVNFIRKVEDLILQIRNAYERGLNDLYSDDILDSSVELKVLESDVNSQIGDFKSDFNLQEDVK